MRGHRDADAVSANHAVSPELDEFVAAAAMGVRMNVNGVGSHGMTALMAAALNHRLDMVLFLLQIGASVDTRSRVLGYTALMHACESPRDRPDAARLMAQFLTAQALVNAAADSVNARDRMGHTPFMIAAMAKYPNVNLLRFLVHRGARANAANFLGLTARHLVAGEDLTPHVLAVRDATPIPREVPRSHYLAFLETAG